jgi:chaperonin GroES
MEQNKQEKSMEIGFKPMGDSVLIIRDEEENVKSASGIITSIQKQQPNQGKIVALGNGFRAQDGSMVPIPLDVGDRIMFHHAGAMEIKVKENVYTLLKTDSILGVIESIEEEGSEEA